MAKSARTKEHVQERAVFVIDNSIFSIFDIINLTRTHTTHSGVCRSEVNQLSMAISFFYLMFFSLNRLAIDKIH